MSIINLLNRDIFDGPCDLIILPCSRSGSVTSFVRNYIQGYKIPYPKNYLELGEVDIMEFTGAENVAQYVGYAASVAGNHSTPEAIQKIAGIIGDFCRSHENVQLVNAPLLGTGAGGLSPDSSYQALIKGFKEKAPENATLNICALSSNNYKILRDKYLKDDTPNLKIRNPRVFLSYAGKDLNNRNWVKNFCIKLRNNGVDARIDQFHMRPGMDLPQWMTNEVINADKVLLICDEIYMEKADNKHGGVGWETMIIQGDMLRQGDNKVKYIAIVRENEVDNALPIFMKSKFSFHWPKNGNKESEEFDKLLFCLFEQDDIPPLGQVPESIKRRLQESVATPNNRI